MRRKHINKQQERNFEIVGARERVFILLGRTILIQLSFVLYFYEYCNIPNVFYSMLYLNAFYRREIFLQVTYIHRVQ